MPEMSFPRASGILLHPTSLPGRFGIGDLGEEAFRFIDFLAASNQHYWQVMPLGPTGYGDSPYQSLSAFAGNPLLISLERLVEDRCLAPWDFANMPPFPADRVDFGKVIEFKNKCLRLSFENFKTGASHELRTGLAEFEESNRWWLDDFSLYAAVKDRHGGESWSSWEKDIATFQSQAVLRWRKELAEEVQYHQYAQFMFHRQWSALKTYANDHGVFIVGDIPIFVAFDSADVWANQELFYFDAYGKPSLVAGVPPDYFSSTGQLWGNPLYRWEVMARDDYAWWTGRVRNALLQADLLRMDHFRGFESYWAVPAREKTAINGKWIKGPGLALFQALEQALGKIPIIAEDLGVITPQVEELRKTLGFPGMKVLQFAFSGEPDHPYLPHNYETNCVVYTGTHDNDTSLGWIRTANKQEREALINYLGGREDELNWELIRLAFMSVANMVIIPVQDVLGLNSEGRMNTPGSAGNNWQWRLAPFGLGDEIAERLKNLTQTYGREVHVPPALSKEPE